MSEKTEKMAESKPCVKWAKEYLPVTDTTALRFWQEQSNGGKFPKLTRIATQLLAIPATSTASERVFSVCGNILTERRCRMQPETLEKLLFLKYNM